MSKSKIEEELLEATGLKPKKYKDRQDYLAALARAVQAIDESEFDKLSNKAADWYNDAVDAINDDKDLDDFPDVEDETDGDGTEAEEEADGDIEGTGGDDDDDGEEDEAPRRSRGKKQEKEKPKAKEKAKPAKGKPASKSKAKDDDDENEAEAEAPPPKKPAKRQTADANVELDKFGIAEGTKNSQAAAMLEKGCKMSDVNSKIGGTYYNLLQRLVKQGHKLLKEPNGELKLVHKDDFGKQAKGGKGKK